MSLPKRILQPVRHPLNNLDNEVESWDNDSELEFQGDEDLFGKLSRIENNSVNLRSTASSSRSSSGHLLESLSFEDQLEQLDLNDKDEVPSFDEFDNFSDFGDNEEEEEVGGKSTIKLTPAAAAGLLGTMQRTEPHSLSSPKYASLSASKQKILEWVEDSEEAELEPDDFDTLKPRQVTNKKLKQDGDIISGSLFRASSDATSNGSPKITRMSPRNSAKQMPPVLSTVTESRQKAPLVDAFEKDEFESDFDLPDNLNKIELKLPSRSRTPANLGDSDAEGGWGEESTSTRFTGSKFTDSSNRSSMISTFSPSSSVTYESEDEGLMGLQIPNGPLNLQQLLDCKMKAVDGDTQKSEADVLNIEREDFLDGLEIGEDDHIFDTAKWTVNKNIKQTLSGDLAKSSPKKPTISQIFAPKPTRIPRPVSQTSNSSPLLQSQPIVMKQERTVPPASMAVSQPRRIGHKSSMASIKPSGSASNQRYGSLLSKKSMPSLRSSASDPIGGDRSLPSLSSAPPLPSLPSRLSLTGSNSVASSPGLRPAASSSNLRRMASRSSLIPPSPASTAQPVTPSIPPFNRFARKPSMSSLHAHIPPEDMLIGRTTLLQATATTASAPMRNTPSPRKRYMENEAPDSVRREAATTKTLLKPVRRRLFGDGTELDDFDDLPISLVKERTFLKRPSAVGGSSKNGTKSSKGKFNDEFLNIFRNPIS